MALIAHALIIIIASFSGHWAAAASAADEALPSGARLPNSGAISVLFSTAAAAVKFDNRLFAVQ